MLLVGKTQLSGVETGYVYLGAGQLASDRHVVVSDSSLQYTATHGHPVTYTCVPRGSGVRIGVDRDGDGAWDSDERDANTDPADPSSRP